MKRLVVTSFAALFIASGVYLLTHLHIVTNMNVFFPKAGSEKERLLAQELRSGNTARLILVGLEGAAPAVLAEANRALAARLAGDAHFSFVANGAEGLSDAAQGQLFAARYLFSPGVSADRFSPASLRESLEQQVRRMASPVPYAGKRHLPADPTDEFAKVLSAWQGNGHVKRLHQVFFSQDEKRSLLIAAAAAGASDLDLQEEAVESLHRAFHAVAPAGVTLRVTGAPVIAVEARDGIRRDSTWLSIFAAVAAGLFLLLIFRSVRPLWLCTVPPLFGTAAATAAVSAVYGEINGITLAFGCTLIGTAIDYPMHFFSHLTRRGLSASEQFRHVWPTLRLGVTTTVVAFAMLMFSDHRGLVELGLFSVVGVIAAALSTRWLLPALIPRGFTVSPGGGLLHTVLVSFARIAPRLRLLWLLLVVAAVGLLVKSGSDVWERDLAKLNYLSDTRKQDDQVLRGDLGAPTAGKLLIAIADSADRAVVTTESIATKLDGLVASGALGGYDLVSHYLPSAAKQKSRQEALPMPVRLRANLELANRGLPFKPEVFEPFLKDVEQARRASIVRAEDLLGTALGARLAPLLFESEGKWVAPILLHGVKDPGPIAALATDEGPARLLYLDTKAEAARLMADYRDAALKLTAVGTLVMFVLLLVSLRSVGRALAVLLVSLASVVTVCGILIASGTALTLFHLVSLLLVIGFGIDYALYFDRLDDHADEWGTTFAALWRSWLTTAGGFGVLVFSTAPTLQAIGTTVSLGVTLCLIFGAASSGRRQHAATLFQGPARRR